MERDIKVLITADLHLGLALSESDVPGNARIATFNRIITLAEEHDLLLIAGDFIDSPSLDDDSIRLLVSGFQRLRDRGTAVIYTAGVGELTQSGDLPAFFDEIALTHRFTRKDDVLPFELSIKEQKLYLYGVPGHRDFPLSRMRRIANDGFHIGLFHADFNTTSHEGLPLVQRDMIKHLGFDFYALGSGHHFRLFKYMDRIIGAYPGSPESVYRDEIGDRYVVSLVLCDHRITQIRRLSANTITVNELVFDCSDQPGTRPLRDILDAAASTTVIQRLILRGNRRFAIPAAFIDDYRTLFHRLIVTDESEPTAEAVFEEFTDDKSLRGEFFRVVRERLELGMIPAGLDRRDLTASMNRLALQNFTTLEEWLCGW